MAHNLSAYTPVVVLNEQSADETSGIVLFGGLTQNTTIIIEGAGTTSSGVITIEEAYYPAPGPYTGTWSLVTTVNASDVTGGAQKAIHVVNWSFWALRIRISTVIGGGGTISATVWGV